MKTKLIIAGIAVALVAGTTVKLFSNKRIVEANIYRPDLNRNVLIQADTAVLKDLNREFVYTGTFIPFKEVMIVPQVPGEVKGVYFSEGDLVTQGQTLVQVDDELLQAQFTSAEANCQTAKRSLDRYENAALGGGVSKLQLDNLTLNHITAQSQVRQLAKQISLSKLVAPITGTITFKDVEYGSVVGSAPVARITDLSKLKLEISVPEKEVGIFREGEVLSVNTDVYPTRTFEGRVLYVAERADESHNYNVKIIIQNNQPSAILKAGMYGTASLKTVISGSSLVIPRSALLGSAKNPQVFLVENNRARLVPIQTGAANGESIEVTDGIHPGQVVVTGGQINLANGTAVEIAK